MKADIPQIEVTDVAIAVVPRTAGSADALWDTYLVNLGDKPLLNVLITSQGHGNLDGRDKTTTVLRHFYDTIDPHSYIKVEPIQRELFGITNEYWVSFNDGEHTLDKRYVFKPGTIGEDNLASIPVLGKKGVAQQ